MAENFNLIFGQNASQQYAWNDADYQNGWETIGNIPPTAAQFDALQRRADTKAQELNSRLTTVEQSIAGGGGQTREADTTYAVGDVVTYDGLPMDWVLVCIVGGTTGSADIILPSPRVEGSRILDGTVTWALRKIATYGGIGYRQSSTSYYTGAIAFSTALPTGWYLECTTAGITSASDLVITSPTVGTTVTDSTVVWTIRSISAEATTTSKGLLSPSDKSKIDNIPAGGGGTGFNRRDVITTSGTWTAPTSGYYKVTCIGGGGAGGNGGTNTHGGGAGTRGGTSSFGTYLSAQGGHSGGGAGDFASGGGGAAGDIAVAYIELSANAVISVTVGAGGVHSTSANSTKIGSNGSGGAAGGQIYTGGQGAISVFGSGNTGSNWTSNDSSAYAPPTGTGGTNGTPYGGGGGGGQNGYLKRYPGFAASGGSNGQAGETVTAALSSGRVPYGGDGGNGAVIIEYFLAV